MRMADRPPLTLSIGTREVLTHMRPLLEARGIEMAVERTQMGKSTLPWRPLINFAPPHAGVRMVGSDDAGGALDLRCNDTHKKVTS